MPKLPVVVHCTCTHGGMMNSPDCFHEVTVNVGSFPENPQVHFGKRVTNLIISHDGGNDVKWSCNGKDLHGIIRPKDQWISFDDVDARKIFFSAIGDGEAVVRVWGWEKQR